MSSIAGSSGGTAGATGDPRWNQPYTGYQCTKCGQWVSHNSSHWCQGYQPYTPIQMPVDLTPLIDVLKELNESIKELKDIVAKQS